MKKEACEDVRSVKAELRNACRELQISNLKSEISDLAFDISDHAPMDQFSFTDSSIQFK